MERNSKLNSMDLNSLIENCVLFFKKNRYNPGIIADYEALWNVGIRSYMSKHNLVLYNADIGLNFSEEGSHQQEILLISLRLSDISPYMIAANFCSFLWLPWSCNYFKRKHAFSIELILRKKVLFVFVLPATQSCKVGDAGLKQAGTVTTVCPSELIRHVPIGLTWYMIFGATM